MHYFDLSEDVYVPGGWLLGIPRDREGNEVRGAFLRGESPRLNGPLRVPVEQPGRALDYSTADTGNAPVVHVKLATLLAELAPTDVQMIPVEIEGQPDQFCIMNVLKVLKCIDEAASEEVHYWKPGSGIPEREGKYLMVLGLRIDPTKVGNARVFRPWGWEVALIVSQDVKEAMERIGALGAEFKEVA